MSVRRHNYAFIDSQNLHLGIRALGWNLDFGRFRRYLSDKYGVIHAFLFIGYVAENETMYMNLRKQGFELVFKNTSSFRGVTKGNVDAEMILQSLIKMPLYDKAVIVTGDGDFLCLAEYLIGISKLEKVLIPNKAACAHALRNLNYRTHKNIDYLEIQRIKLEYKK